MGRGLGHPGAITPFVPNVGSRLPDVCAATGCVPPISSTKARQVVQAHRSRMPVIDPPVAINTAGSKPPNVTRYPIASKNDLQARPRHGAGRLDRDFERYARTRSVEHRE